MPCTRTRASHKRRLEYIQRERAAKAPISSRLARLSPRGPRSHGDQSWRPQHMVVRSVDLAVLELRVAQSLVIACMYPRTSVAGAALLFSDASGMELPDHMVNRWD